MDAPDSRVGARQQGTDVGERLRAAALLAGAAAGQPESGHGL